MKNLQFDVGANTNLLLDFVKPGRTYSFEVVAYSPEQIESDPSEALDYLVPIPFGWPIVLLHPVPVAVREGGSAFFAVQALGIGLRYQWLKDDQDIPGETNIFLSIPSVSNAQAGHYSVRVANNLGEIESEAARLSLLSLPTIISQERSVHVRVGDSVSLYVHASGTDPLRYTWLKGSQVIQEGDDSQLFVPESTLADAGVYSVVVSNEFGSLTSGPISVVIEEVKSPQVLIQRSRSDLVLSVNGYPIRRYVIEALSALEQDAWLFFAEVETDEEGNAAFILSTSDNAVRLFRVFEMRE